MNIWEKMEKKVTNLAKYTFKKMTHKSTYYTCTYYYV